MIENPVQLREALNALSDPEPDDETAASLAALILGCSLMLQSSDEFVISDFKQDTDLQWPRIEPMWGERIPEEWLREADKLAGEMSRLLGSVEGVQPEDLRWFGEQLFDLEHSSRARVAAIALPLICMVHPHPLIHVCAAVASSTLARNPLRVGQSFNLLMDYSGSPNEMLQHLAFIGLSRAFKQGVSTGLRKASSGFMNIFGSNANQVNTTPAAKDAVLVHGTVLQKHGSPLDLWWKPPSGDLHQYLKNGSMSHLYTSADHFRWSGGWSEYAREEAADKLIYWLSSKGIQQPDVIGHSHGCNVSMLASQTTDLNRLILLSCPVHWSSYRPGKVQDVLSIRTRWDLVIMADGGAQRFPSGIGIREHILPFWFTGHDESHSSGTWKSQNLDRLL